MGAHFVCFPSFNDQSLALSIVQYLKTVDEYVFSSFIIVCGRKDIPILATPSWPKKQVSESFYVSFET